MEANQEKRDATLPAEAVLVYSFTALPSLMRRVQNLANQKHDGNRSAMIVELLEIGMEKPAR